MKIFRGSTGSGKTTKMFEYAKENFEGKRIGIISSSEREAIEKTKDKGIYLSFSSYEVPSIDLEYLKILIERYKLKVILIDGVLTGGGRTLFDLIDLERGLGVTVLYTAQTIFSERHGVVSVINVEVENGDE